MDFRPRPSLFVFFLLSILFSFGCMHKNVMSDSADDILASFIYSGSEGTFLVQWESIFQANSKESNGGVTHISGYSERRLSSYDLGTGEMKARVELGEQIEEANELLGFSPGKIWMFSIEEELGLHYRDPLTLEVKEDWSSLSKRPGLSSFQPSKPEWAQIPSYYGMDWKSGKLILTDLQGYHYQLDPNDFSLTKSSEELRRQDWEDDPYSSSAQLKKDDYYSLSGNPRRKIEFRGKSSPEELSFLEGEFILDLNPENQGRRKNAYFSLVNAEIKALQDSVARIKQAHPELDIDHPKYHEWNSEQNTLWREKQDLGRKADRLKDDLKRMDNFHEEVMRSPLLSPDGKTGFIRHAGTLTDTAKILVSKVIFNPDTTWTLAWTTHIPSIYFDYSKADQAGAFETVFSKGNPTFDYAWAGMTEDKLILVEQLRMVCLDVKSGKLMWASEEE